VIAGILLGIVSGLLANEFCEFSPWCARELVRWSAFRRYANPGRAEMRAEELTALINERPGNLFKLFTAAGFAGAAVIVSVRRAVARESDVAAGSGPALHALHAVPCSEVLDRVYGYLDGDLDDHDCAMIRQHLDECGPCLREYGLEEAVKRLVHKHHGDGPASAELRAKVIVRIKEVRTAVKLAE
jgi:mycothiol system anti-sigma-R factor